MSPHIRTYVLDYSMSDQASQKRCSRCGQTKDVREFSFKSRVRGLLHSFCRPCHKVWNRSHYERHRATYITSARRNSSIYQAESLRRVLEYLREHPCVDCGESDPVVLDFDHRDRSTKRLPVGAMLRDFAWAQIELEIA